MVSAHALIAPYAGGVEKTSKKVSPVGRNVKRLREKLGLSQEELAERAGLSSVAMIESGVRPSPRRPTATKLADALGVTVADLYVDEPAPMQPEAQAAYDEFRASPMARDIKTHEEEFLQRFRWPPGVTPTPRSWLHLYEALRASNGALYEAMKQSSR